MYKTGLAIALSILFPGAGHIYAKKGKLGLGLLFAYLAGISALIFFPLLDLEIKFEIVFGLVMLLLFSIYDSRNLVRRLNMEEERAREESPVPIEEGEYYFRRNLYLPSTQPVPIYDFHGNLAGTIQRYYKNWWIWLIYMVTNIRFIYLRGINQRGEQVIQIEELSFRKSLFSKFYTLQVTVGHGPEQERFLLKNTTYQREGISVNHIYEFVYKGENYTLKKEYMIKTSTIKKANGKTIAEFIQEDPVSAMDHSIRILDPSVDLLLVTTVYYVFLLQK
jgi:hypothetical protein